MLQSLPLLLLVCITIKSSCCMDTITVNINVDANPRSTPINPSFASNSIEWNQLGDFMGTYPYLNTKVMTLLGTLINLTGGAPVLRIGGDSSDGNNEGVHNTTVMTVSKFANAIGSKVVYGLDFRNPSAATVAIDEIRTIDKFGGWDNVKALEIGNEVDLYVREGIRNASWNYSLYKSDFEFYAAQLTDPKVTGVNLPTKKIFQGAVLCCEGNFVTPMYQPINHGFFADETEWSASYSIHWYPSGACPGQTTSLLYILSDEVVNTTIAHHTPLSLAAQMAGVEYWIGESNSVACSGAVNVSDVFGAALWSVDYMLDMANLNVTGINFHHGSHYSNFDWIWSTEELDVRGLFYGMWMFYLASRANSVVLTPTSISSSNVLIRAHVVYDLDSKELRIIIVHKDISALGSANVVVSIADYELYSSKGSYFAMKAPSPYSVHNITIGGQTFDNTKDGNPSGEPIALPITGNQGSYTLDIEPSSAVLLIVPRQSGQ